MDTVFVLNAEKRGSRDPEGALVGGAERSVLRVHHFTRVETTT